MTRLRMCFHGSRSMPIAMAVLCVCGIVGLSLPAVGQTLIYQEGFNDDGEGTRWTSVGQGSDPNGPDGPGEWDVSVNVSKIGLVDAAPAKRAAILWANDVPFDVTPEDFWTEDALDIFMNVVDWAVDGKQDANVYFLPDPVTLGNEFLFETIEGAGYTVDFLFAGDDIPNNADLVINTGDAAPVPPTFLADKDVAVLSFNAGNHDDTLVAQIGLVELIDPPEVTVVPANQNHPVLGGRTGTIEWATEPWDMQGIGVAPSGATVLATYENPSGNEFPAVVLIEEGGGLLGGFNPTPEGTGYWVGGDLNLDFAGFAALADDPRVLELSPVDVTGRDDVRLTVALAGTNADFEPDDYLRILIDPNNSGDFQLLADFVGVDEPGSADNKALRDTIDGVTALSPDAFRDITFDIPQGATELVVRFESYNTFPNEIVGIDNVRITAGNTVLQAGDADQDFDFDQLDLVKVQIAAKYLTGQPATWGEGDWNGAPGGAPGSPPAGNGLFDQLDVIAALGNGLYLTGPYAALAGNGTANDGQTSIVYDPTTGEVAVDAPAGVELTSINVDSAGGVFTGEAAQNLGGSFDNDADNNIFKATFGGSFGSITFGNVAQAGLSEDFVLNDFTVVGSLAGGGALGNVDLIYVPEPSSLMLVGAALVALLGAAGRRRGAV